MSPPLGYNHSHCHFTLCSGGNYYGLQTEVS
uniref:Uncharacterized protein n=1 Tax=Arundo donax TaxID=35708 RepID=A0A0A9GZ01_ARUDO